jgi:predicted ABC-type ATPase
LSNNLYIIAGCNGAGKTTASFTILPEILNCYEFVNADEIARGLSPFQPEKVAVEAGRIMLKRIEELFKLKVDFAFETTFASKTYKEKVLYAQANGYKVTLLFFWLNSVELAIERVLSRVSKGGHNIPKDIIKRRYTSGLINLFEIYLPLVDDFMIVDNSDTDYYIIAEGSKNGEITINDASKWEQLKA